MMDEETSTGQVSTSAAEIYDAFFVPALFAQWAGPLCDSAGVSTGDRVLDVACGSGATTREAAARVAPGGAVTGLDCNDGMLAVAAAHAPEITWVAGMAEALPFEDGAFDAVLCQFGLMFFENRAKALGEMRRVVRPGGRVALSVWDAVETSPGYARMIALIAEMFGDAPARELRAPFVLGDKAELSRLLEEGGLAGAQIKTVTGTARFASIREWVRMDVRGWTLGDMIDDDGFEALVAAAEQEMGDDMGADGMVQFDAPAHLIGWEKG